MHMHMQCQWYANDVPSSEKTVLLLCTSGGTFALISIYLHHLQTYDIKVLVTCNQAGATLL